MTILEFASSNPILTGFCVACACSMLVGIFGRSCDCDDGDME